VLLNLKLLLAIVAFAFINSSCEKEVETVIIEGFIKDYNSLEPIAGIQIFVDAIQSGMGLLDGRRESVGKGTTNMEGYYQIKLRIFKEAENIELFINAANSNGGYVSIQPNISLTSINRSGNNTLNFLLNSTALLKIKFKNLNPVGDSDLFHFSWYSNGAGTTKGILQKENCGTVVQNEAASWIGKDVCGQFTIDAIAENATYIYWTVRKNNVTISI
jgi:hypothetical protein